MKAALHSCKLLVKQSMIQGYGVFADEDIAAGSIIEEAHTISCAQEVPDLFNYIFSGKGKRIIALGYGSIYNHSKNPNAEYEFDEETKLMVFRAKKGIQKGEEIYISYGKHWFAYRDMPIKSMSMRFGLRKHFLPMLARFSLVVSFIFLFVYGLPFFQ